jgi:hypothetical protein
VNFEDNQNYSCQSNIDEQKIGKLGLNRMERAVRGNIYHLTILGLIAITFVPDREHNVLPLEK